MKSGISILDIRDLRNDLSTTETNDFVLPPNFWPGAWFAVGKVTISFLCCETECLWYSEIEDSFINFLCIEDPVSV